MTLPATPPLAISFKTASELSSLSRTTLRQMAKDGRLVSRKIGRRRLVLYSSLLAILDDRK